MTETKVTGQRKPPEELAGFTTKLYRADEHREQLKTEINSWIALEPVSGRHEVDESAGQILVYCEFNPLPNLDRWAVLIGDIVHNLRSALDHLAWQLVILNREEPIEGTTAFPIFRSTKAWSDHSGNRVAGMSDEVVAEIERLQPYHRGNDAEKTRLWILHQLNRDDKHRLLTPVVIRSEEFKWEIEPEPVQITVTPTMQHDTPFMFVTPSEGLANVHVEARMSSRIAISLGPGREIETVGLLNNLRNEVANVGNIFGRFFV